jgi:hypothetical protein
MDPKLMEALQSNKNPFEDLVNKAKMSPNQNTGGSPTGMAGALAAQAGGASAKSTAPADATNDVTQPGVNPGTSKPLLSALSSLHQFITAATDPSEIALVRSIIVLLTQLIQRDQASQAQGTETAGTPTE